MFSPAYGILFHYDNGRYASAPEENQLHKLLKYLQYYAWEDFFNNCHRIFNVPYIFSPAYGILFHYDNGHIKTNQF